jgi:PEP-CTERM motif-containing protein
VIVSPPAQNGSAAISVLTSLNNTGNITIQAPATGVATTFTLAGINGAGDGSFNVGADCVFDLISHTLNAGATITGAGRTSFIAVTIAGDTNVATSVANLGSLVIQKGATLMLNGTFDQPAAPPTQGGTTLLNGGTITSAHALTFGQNTTLTGSGTINGDVASGATISPGASAGTLVINGNVSLLDGSKLVMEIGGLTQETQYDHLAVGGMVTLDGTLELHMLNGFQLQLDPSQTFTLLTSKDILSGAFDNVANGARLTTADGLASFQVNYGTGSSYGANNLVLSDPQAVPEPASLMLLAGGAVIFGCARFHKRQRR